MKINSSEKGQALIIITFAAIVLFGFAALAIDGSMAFSDKRHAQNAADTAVLDAALSKTRGGSWAQEGLDRASSNGYNDNGTSNDVEVHNPPLDGNYAGNNEYVQVKIVSHVNTVFARVIGFDRLTNRVEAVARSVPGTNSTMVFGNAVVSLSPDECDATWSHGNSDVAVIGGGIFTNSDCDDAFRQNGSGSLTAPSISVVGGASFSDGHVFPEPTTGATQLEYPPFTMPNPACGGNAVKTGNTLSPGTYEGTFPPNGVTQLQGGIYCIDGPFRLNGGDSLTGHEVVIVMLTDRLVWNGGSSANLSAPTSGPFKGLLIFFPMENDSELQINGNSNMGLTGSILAPASHIELLGTGAVDGFNSQVIGFTVEYGGTGDGTIRYDDENNFDADNPPQIELTQ
ncbi:MAG: Tad domain-containing protein [Chloroflexota bacterium]|nr:Tad domain-containing protein [Chloroflexota bacterium]